LGQLDLPTSSPYPEPGQSTYLNNEEPAPRLHSQLSIQTALHPRRDEAREGAGEEGARVELRDGTLVSSARGRSREKGRRTYEGGAESLQGGKRASGRSVACSDRLEDDGRRTSSCLVYLSERQGRSKYLTAAEIQVELDAPGREQEERAGEVCAHETESVLVTESVTTSERNAQGLSVNPRRTLTARSCS